MPIFSQENGQVIKSIQSPSFLYDKKIVANDY